MVFAYFVTFLLFFATILWLVVKLLSLLILLVFVEEDVPLNVMENMAGPFPSFIT